MRRSSLMSEEQTTEISIEQIIRICITNLKWIILATVLTGLVFLFVSAVIIEPKYTAVTSIYVYNPEISTTTTTAYTAGSYIADGYYRKRIRSRCRYQRTQS